MSLTCSHYNGYQRHGLTADVPTYWKSPAGITRRIDSLAQAFNYGTFNKAEHILGQTNKVDWLYWITAADDRVCPICIENSVKGDRGRFKPGWFLPVMPAHALCRCQWMLVWET